VCLWCIAATFFLFVTVAAKRRLQSIAMLTAKDAAKRAGVTKRTLLRWIREDQLKAERVETSTGPGYAVDEADLDRLMKDRAERLRKFDAQVEKLTAKSEAVAASAGHEEPPMAETSQSQADALSEALAALREQLKVKDEQIAQLNRRLETEQLLLARAQDQAQQALPSKSSRPWWKLWR